MADGKTIIIGSPQKQQQQQQQQILIRPSKDSMTQQIIRIPASKVVASSAESSTIQVSVLLTCPSSSLTRR
jgi:hypothetical protein